MTRRERDELMRYVGILEGFCMFLRTDDGDEDTDFVRNNLMGVASDMEGLARGVDKFDISKIVVMKPVTTTSEPLEGGDDDDV